MKMDLDDGLALGLSLSLIRYPRMRMRMMKEGIALQAKRVFR